MDTAEVEQVETIAQNWREAEEAGDRAAAEAFEDELHARLTAEEIGAIQGHDPRTGEPSAAETERLRGVLQRMWRNASARLD